MKFWITVGVLGAIIVGVVIYAFMLNGDLKEERLAHAETKQTLESLKVYTAESTVNIYRTSQAVKQGTIFNPAAVEVVPIPASLSNDSYILSPEALQGALWRLNMPANSIITADMLVYEPVHPSDRFHVVSVDSHTPSLAVGAFVDIRMITPEGIDFVVLPRMRVVNIYSSGLEMVLSETQWMIYIGALIDKALNPGTLMYAGMYVDPGLQPALYASYIPPRHIVEYMNINKNMLFPYVDGTNVSEVREFIESTFPRNVYRHTLFASPDQALRDRENRISGAMSGQIGATATARSEFVQRMQAIAAREGEVRDGDYSEYAQVVTPGVQGSAVGQGPLNQGDNQIRANGTWVDDQGVERNPDGSPVIKVDDMFDTSTDGPLGGNDAVPPAASAAAPG
jgi:hypothetical protein